MFILAFAVEGAEVEFLGENVGVDAGEAEGNHP